MTTPTDLPSAERREEVMALWRKYHCPYYYGFLEPIWPFVAALDAQSAERTRAEVEAAKSEHERIMAECYQAVGMISESLGCQDDENYIRLLDMLAYGKTEDGKELLPFPVLPNLKARAGVEKMREALIGIVGDTACPECGWAGTIITRMRALSLPIKGVRDGTHAQDCHLWGPRHYDCLMREYEASHAEIARLREALEAAEAATPSPRSAPR